MMEVIKTSCGNKIVNLVPTNLHLYDRTVLPASKFVVYTEKVNGKIIPFLKGEELEVIKNLHEMHLRKELDIVIIDDMLKKFLTDINYSFDKSPMKTVAEMHQVLGIKL